MESISPISPSVLSSFVSDFVKSRSSCHTQFTILQRFIVNQLSTFIEQQLASRPPTLGHPPRHLGNSISVVGLLLFFYPSLYNYQAFNFSKFALRSSHISSATSSQRFVLSRSNFDRHVSATRFGMKPPSSPLSHYSSISSASPVPFPAESSRCRHGAHLGSAACTCNSTVASSMPLATTPEPQNSHSSFSVRTAPSAPPIGSSRSVDFHFPYCKFQGHLIPNRNRTASGALVSSLSSTACKSSDSTCGSSYSRGHVDKVPPKNSQDLGVVDTEPWGVSGCPSSSRGYPLYPNSKDVPSSPSYATQPRSHPLSHLFKQLEDNRREHHSRSCSTPASPRPNSVSEGIAPSSINGISRIGLISKCNQAPCCRTPNSCPRDQPPQQAVQNRQQQRSYSSLRSSSQSYHCRSSTDNNDTSASDFASPFGSISRISPYMVPNMGAVEFESRFFEILNNHKSPGRTKLHRLHDAARFLFTGGTGTPPLYVSTGKQGYPGPSFQCILALRSVIETVTLSDLQLDPQTILRNYRACLNEQKNSGSQRVAAFWNIVDTPMLAIVLFLLPLGCPLEVHGHPGMVVLSKVLLGSLNAQVVSALGPIDHTESGSEHAFPDGDPGAAMLPVDEHVLDFGAVPSSQESDHGSANQYAQLKMSRRISERSSLRRRMIVGSRAKRRIGEEFDCIELFNGIINHSTKRHQSPPATSPRGEQSDSSSFTGPISTDGGGTSLGHSGSPPAKWDSIVPNDSWPSTVVCTPCIGNLHRFEPRSEFVLVLDVISPSYEVPKARECQYVTIDTHNSAEGESDAMLTEDGIAGSKPPRVNGYPQVRVAVVDDEVAGPEVFLEFETRAPTQ